MGIVPPLRTTAISVGWYTLLLNGALGLCPKPAPCFLPTLPPLPPPPPPPSPPACFLATLLLPLLVFLPKLPLRFFPMLPLCFFPKLPLENLAERRAELCSSIEKALFSIYVRGRCMSSNAVCRILECAVSK